MSPIFYAQGARLLVGGPTPAQAIREARRLQRHHAWRVAWWALVELAGLGAFAYALRDFLGARFLTALTWGVLAVLAGGLAAAKLEWHRERYRRARYRVRYWREFRHLELGEDL